MVWRDPRELTDVGEYVIRLENTGHDVFWLGRSVHQIATVDAIGEVWAQGRCIDRDAINGWMPLPRGARGEAVN